MGDFDISAIFEFVAKNPPMALIVGGILFILVGTGINILGLGSDGGLIFLGILMIIVGIVLHMEWLGVFK